MQKYTNTNTDTKIHKSTQAADPATSGGLWPTPSLEEEADDNTPEEKDKDNKKDLRKE